MDSIKTALKLLEKDRINNISTINFIKNNKIMSADIIGSSVLIRGTSDRNWVYISCRDKSELNIIKSKLTKEDDNFAVIDEWMMPILIEGKELVWSLSANQFYLPENIKLPCHEMNITSLTVEDAQTIYDNSEYKEYISTEYVKDRIKNGPGAGIRENNKLVCWNMTQDDGALGFLHTLDEYRKKGYAYNVTLAMIEKLRRINELPFAYVVKHNQRSINLLLKLGFKQNKTVHWFQVR